MINLFPYILKVVIISGLTFSFYYFLLRKLTYFRMNRCFLLLSMLLSIILPLIKFNFLSQNVESVTYTLNNVVISANDVVVKSELNYLLFAYSLIALLFIFIFSISLISIFKLSTKSTKKLYNSKQLFVSEKSVCPFSFFSNIFVDNRQYEDKESLNSIIEHEDVHISQFHSVDVIVSELLTAIFWMNPFFWLTKKYIKLNHEYIADELVLNKGFGFIDYSMLILATVNGAKRFGIANNLKEGLTYKRIKMMKKNRSYKSKKLVYLMVLPLIALSAILISWNDIDDVNVENNTGIETLDVTYVKNDTILPKWKDGGTSGLMQYIADKVVYPKVSQENGDEGKVYVKFFIDVDGSVVDVSIEQGVSDELNKEALRVIENMPKWAPGKINNKKAKFVFVIPINFKLS